MARFNDGGILLVEKDSLLVWFSKSSYYRNAYSSVTREECKKVFASHGFMEPVQLPYRIDLDGLIVISPSKEAQAVGWLSSLDIEDNDIPF